MATVKEIRAELEALGVDAPAGARKAELEALLDEARGEAPWAVVTLPARLNVRTSPEVADNVDDVVMEGTLFEAVSEDGEWTRLADGRWVMTRWLRRL